MKKKKIVFINNHFQTSDGTVRALIGIVNNLDTEKFDVTVMPVYRCDRKLQSQLRQGIRLKTVFGFYFRGFSKLVRFVPVSWLYRKYIGGKYDIEVAFQCGIPTLLVGNSPDVHSVHVIWMHGYEFYPREHCLCDKLVCVSKYCADKARKDSRDMANVTYRYNLMDDAIVVKGSEEGIDLEYVRSPLFVSVGRLSPEKGYVRLVEILSELRDEGYGFHLILVGGGPEYKSITESVKTLKMEKWITLVGADVNPHKYTAKADVFICSSFNEGYSTACTEAAILGIPVITTSVPGGEEIINDCECGILTGLEDSSLKAGIKKVLEHPELIAEWKRTMQRTKEKFGFRARKQAMDHLVEEIYKLSDKKQNEE